MDTNKMREQFETAAKSQGLSLVRTQQALLFANGASRAAGDYVALETLCSWWAWQASRSAVVVDLPPKISAHNTSEGGFVRPEVAHYDEAIDDCREAIKAQGLKVEVKP